MENKLFYLYAEEGKQKQQQLSLKKDIYIVDMDGANIPTLKEYLEACDELFKFPEDSLTAPNNTMGYYDWITDLSWLEKEEYAFFIYNISQFMRNDLEEKVFIINNFSMILNFWEKEIIDVVVNGQPSPFNIYLVD